jgi:glutamyl-tRNA reductase
VNFLVVGLSHKTAPVEIREQAFIPTSAIGECVQRLIDRDLVESGVLLSTCNRTELYAVAAGEQAEDRLLESFGLWPHHLPFADWRRYAYRLAGRQAMAHLFRVAAGIESTVLGEGQVLGQLKDAVETARGAGVVNPSLGLILEGAIRAGKRVRHETALSRRPVSISHAAVVMAQHALGDLRTRGVLLLGAGAMSEIALGLLKNRGIGELFIASRTIDRAQRVGAPLGATSVAMDRLADIAGRIDLILSSSSAPHHVFDTRLVREMQSRRGQRPLLIIDLAVPRDVEPAVSAIEGVQLLDIDDLHDVTEETLQAREASLPAAQAIIDAEVHRTIQLLKARQSSQQIVRLLRAADGIRDAVLAEHLARLAHADMPTDRRMHELAHALTAKLMHEPIAILRENSADPLTAEGISGLFVIDED